MAGCAEALLAAGCDATAVDNEGSTGLKWAADCGHTVLLPRLRAASEEAEERRHAAAERAAQKAEVELMAMVEAESAGRAARPSQPPTAASAKKRAKRERQRQRKRAQAATKSSPEPALDPAKQAATKPESEQRAESDSAVLATVQLTNRCAAAGTEVHCSRSLP